MKIPADNLHVLDVKAGEKKQKKNEKGYLLVVQKKASNNVFAVKCENGKEQTH